jgi:hypothetical protein
MSRLVAQFSGPPADRMAGRATARAARAAAASPKGLRARAGKPAPAAPAAEAGISAATAARANAFLAREALLDEAINCGVISANLRGHYGRCYDADPSGTRSYLQSIGLRPSQSTQAASSEEYDNSALSRAERSRIAAAREGKTPRIGGEGL